MNEQKAQINILKSTMVDKVEKGPKPVAKLPEKRKRRTNRYTVACEVNNAVGLPPLVKSNSNKETE